jgi:hypothetical protein
LTLLARCEDVTEKQQIAIFTVGLPPQMGIDVELQNSASLDDTMSLARAYERRQQLVDDASRPALRPTRPPVCAPLSSASGSKSPATPATMGSTSTMPGAPLKPPQPGARFTKLSPEEMAQQCLDGLCYNCPEKFSREHIKQCTIKGIYFLKVAGAEEHERARRRRT